MRSYKFLVLLLMVSRSATAMMDDEKVIWLAYIGTTASVASALYLMSNQIKAIGKATVNGAAGLASLPKLFDDRLAATAEQYRMILEQELRVQSELIGVLVPQKLREAGFSENVLRALIEVRVEGLERCASPEQLRANYRRVMQLELAGAKSVPKEISESFAAHMKNMESVERLGVYESLMGSVGGNHARAVHPASSEFKPKKNMLPGISQAADMLTAAGSTALSQLPGPSSPHTPVGRRSSDGQKRGSLSVPSRPGGLERSASGHV